MPPLAIALDLGGTQARGALVDAAGTVLQRAGVATAAAAGPAVVVQQLHDLVATVARDVPPSRIRGVGVCAPGPLDTVSGTALDIPTIAGFVDLPLRRMLEDRFALPVWLENDGIAAALGEWQFGAGRGYANVVYVTVSTGIGAGVIAEGRVLRGRMGLAGHAGHMTIARNGELCPCGNRGCWEAYGSGSAFTRRARRRAAAESPSALSAAATTLEAADVFAAAAAGDPLARDLVAEEADILGIGIGSLLHLYSPDVVVLGGGMSVNFDVLAPGIHARLDAAAMRAFRDIAVVPAALAGNSGLIGAAALVFAETRHP